MRHPRWFAGIRLRQSRDCLSGQASRQTGKGGVQQQTGVLSFVLLAAGFSPDTKSGCPARPHNLASRLHRCFADIWKLGANRVVSRGFFCTVRHGVARQFRGSTTSILVWQYGLRVDNYSNWPTNVPCTKVFLGKQTSVTFLSNVEQSYGRHSMYNSLLVAN